MKNTLFHERTGSNSAFLGGWNRSTVLIGTFLYQSRKPSAQIISDVQKCFWKLRLTRSETFDSA